MPCDVAIPWNGNHPVPEWANEWAKKGISRILFKNQEITFALAHLRERQEQTTPTFAEIEF